ncbi:MAG TPA: FAD-dependent oxidoreductase, partial [Clostridia bacterium]|nr:FAD-dependent oxidoreductase [Clostridia bacterium]
MRYIKDIQTKYSYELVVCGGGMSGFASAISAASKGIKTLIVERNGCLGGVATSCMVNHLLGAKHVDSSTESLKKNISGLFDVLADRLISKNYAIDPNKTALYDNPHGWYSTLAEGLVVSSEGLKMEMELMCKESGVDILYLSHICDVIKDESSISHIIVHNKSGLFAIEGKCFVDATSDADIAVYCGCPYIKGRETDGLMAPASLMMHLENVNTEKLRTYIRENNEHRFKKLIKVLKEKGIWSFPYDIFICVQLTKPDTYMINTIRQVGVDGTDGLSISNAILDGRDESFRLFEIVKNHFPGFENSAIFRIADNIGIRETNRIKGVYTLTVEDLIENKKFDDTIAISSYGWDLPDPNKPSIQPMEKTKRKNCYTYIPY